MTADYPTAEIPATPEYVFTVLRHTLSWSSEREELTLDTDVSDFLAMHDDLARQTTQGLSDLMTAIFCVEIPLADWQQAFPSVWHPTMREVCDFLASRITRPMVRPWNHVAGECRPAGAFLTVRAMLAERGFDPQRIAPSTSLNTVSTEELHHLCWRLTLLEPGRLPDVNYTFRGGIVGCGTTLARTAAGTLILFSLITFAASLVARNVPALVASVAILVASFKSLRRLDKFSEPVSVHLGELCTFRDLAYCLAGQQPRRRIQPSA